MIRKSTPFFFVLSLALAMNTWAQTNVGGNILSDSTWTIAHSPIIVTSNISVSNGATLTIESGVEVRFNDNLGLNVPNGILNASGATFTSNNASPTNGIWTGIQLRTNAAHVLNGCNILYATNGLLIDKGSVTLNNTSINNSGQNGISATNLLTSANTTITADQLSIAGTGASYSGISATRTSLNLTNSSIVNVGTSGIYLSDDRSGYGSGSASSSVTGTTISGASNAGLHVTNNATIDLGGNNFTGNLYPIQHAQVAHVTYSAANTYNNTRNMVYLVDATYHSDVTLQHPGIPYYVYNLIIASGATLTIEPGSILKFDYPGVLDIRGNLIADGTEENKIYFTSYADDNLAGDTNGDSNDTSPSSRPWSGIYFSGGAANSLMDFCEVRWANYTSNNAAIVTRASSPTLTNNTLINSYYGVRFEGASAPVFTGNTIGSSTVTPVAMSFEASPTFSNNTFSTSDNQYDAIGLIGGELTADATIIKRNFTDIPNVTYVMLDRVTVPQTRTLTIEDGVVIKGLSSHDFIIHGKLLVNGTSESKVVFTSVNDDNHGNPLDTRNDGTNQIPAVGHMGGIYFSETSSSESLINHAIIKFAAFDELYQQQNIFDTDIQSNYSWWYYFNAAVSINRSSPTIQNTLISEVPIAVDIRGICTPSITNNTFSNTGGVPIRLSVQSKPDFSGNTINSVGRKAIGILPEVINYTDTLRALDFAGFPNITYQISELVVNEGASLALDEGLTIKVDQYGGVRVFGAFQVLGTSENPVTITAIADDNVGNAPNPTDNDTEGNGNATNPNTSQWGGIIFYAGSNDASSKINHAVLKYGGYHGAPVIWQNASATISNSSLEFSNNYGLLMRNNSNPEVSNVTIRTSTLDPIGMSFFADPIFTDIIFDTNGSNGLRLIDGTLSANATVRKRDVAGINNIAYIMGYLTINSGATLTINPGVVVKMVDGHYITVGQGAINAQGTSSEKIIFTSIRDDSRGGDTNIDGNGSAPAAGNWGGIYFGPSNVQSELNYCEVRYVGSAYYSADKYGSIISENNALIFRNSLVQLSTANAFGIYGTSTATIENNRLENIASFPVHMSMFANPTFSGNTVENVRYMAIGVREETFSQSATFPFRSFASVDSITYMPTYWSGYGFKVTSGTKITVPAGMVFKYNSYTLFDVDGELHMAGTAENPIILTTIEDDQYGRPLDTENNGPATNLYISGRGLVFRNVSSDNSLIEGVLFRYKSYGVELVSASPMISNNIFERCTFGVGAQGISEPHITSNTFRNLDFTPFHTSMVAYPKETDGNVLEGTTYKAVHINNETLTQDTVLIKRSFGGIDNIPYLFSGYTVGLGVKLTIEPGVILKFSNSNRNSQSPSGQLVVQGALRAVGGPNSDSTIVFTSDKDDFYGGDTNGDSTATNGLYGFGGIVFTNESSDSESVLDNVIIRFGSSHGLTLNSASPTIRNSVFKECGYYSGTGALLITGASNPTLESNDFLDNYPNEYNGYAINNTGSFTVDARGTWWGSNSGPYEPTLNPTGTGNAVKGNVLFDPWATENMLNPVTGDISLNGNVTAYDAALGLQSVAEIITLNDRQIRAADVSGNGEISSMDASYILQYSAGMIRHFPAEAENKRIQENWVSTHSAIAVALSEAWLDAPDQLIEVPVHLSNVHDLYALELAIGIDPALSLVEFKPAGWEGIPLTTHLVAARNEFRIALAEMDPIRQDALLGTLVLKASGPITRNELSLTVNRLIGNETNLTSSTSPGKVHVGLAVLSTTAGSGWSIYPNPAASQLKVDFPVGEKGTISLMDMQGKVILSREAQGSATLNLPKLNNGLYLLKIQTAKETLEQKIVINQ